MMPAESAASLPRLGESIAAELARWIDTERLDAGVQLPTEKVLCERFNVSRSVIREAISRLKADGVVRTRQGSGAFVAARPGQTSFRLIGPDPDLQASRMTQLHQVFELRFLIETGAAELAALRRSADDLVRLDAALQRMDDALVVGLDAAADDDAFHVAVAAATGNPQIQRFQAFMGQRLSDSRSPTWSAHGHLVGRARQAQQEHMRIHAAIVAGDGAAARQAAAEHLIAAAGRLGLPALAWDPDAVTNTNRDTSTNTNNKEEADE